MILWLQLGGFFSIRSCDSESKEAAAAIAKAIAKKLRKLSQKRVPIKLFISVREILWLNLFILVR